VPARRVEKPDDREVAEIAQLVRSFNKIGDPSRRTAVISLVKTIAGDAI
jgi:hypothetical protein